MIDATHLHTLDRELTLYEIAQMTRSGPATCLGLKNLYGGLAPGQIADVAVFDLNYKNLPSDPEKIESAFQRAACFVKSGEIVVKDGEVLGHGHKKTVWVNVNMPENPQVKRDITESFTKDYTVQLENYSVRDYLAPHPFVINVDVEA